MFKVLFAFKGSLFLETICLLTNYLFMQAFTVPIINI